MKTLKVAIGRTALIVGGFAGLFAIVAGSEWMSSKIAPYWARDIVSVAVLFGVVGTLYLLDKCVTEALSETK